MFKYLFILLLSSIALSACTSKDGVAKILKENPEVLTDAIKANPSKILMALQEASRAAQEDMAKNRQAEEAKEIENSIVNPLKPEIRSDDFFWGAKDAPITLVIYSDFQCPFCERGFKNEKQLIEKYSGKIRVLFKNLPLPMHQYAMIAAQYYTGIFLQSPEKAEKFHDKVFSNQQGLEKGEAFLKATASSLNVDLKKLASDIKSDKVKNRIKQDMDEASKFGFEGTPGYLLNGVPVKGAYPVSHFVDIIEQLKQKGKLTL